jgi:ribonuclease Y
MVSIVLVIGLLLFAAGVGLLFFANGKHNLAQRLLYQAELRVEITEKEVASERREALLKLKDELNRRRMDFKIEIKRERAELDKVKEKALVRIQEAEHKELELGELKRTLQTKEREISRSFDQMRIAEEKIRLLQLELAGKLEHISNMTQEQARQELFAALKSEVRHSHEKWLQKVEDDTKAVAKEKSMSIIVDAMQRYTAEQVSLSAAGVVHLPNDDMKGRIIGKEGRNIKALEMATGMEFVIGDTPEIITISGFNPVRREIARRSLEKLVLDGRINPTRIEEVVAQTEQEIDEIIQDKGKNAVMQLNLHGVAPEMVTLLGRLHFRTSFSQNVLSHSIEVATMARMLAEELGLPRPDLAARAGLFHDMGKAVSSEHEGPHAILGAEVARRCGENPIVVNAIAAHHEEVPFKTLYDPLIVIADTISASRPGARRETLTAYIKRLEKLETIALNFAGVKKAYALQAGREIRIIVQEDVLGDQESLQLAREIADAVEAEMNFPGQIKISVIRETRAIEYAK